MKRIIALDGIRGIAILLIIVWHYCSNQAQFESAGYVLHATKLFWSGVDLFFVLSGFLIVGILLDKRDTSNYYKVFYIRRFCRILPLYYLLVIVHYFREFSMHGGIDYIKDNIGSLFVYLLFLQNFLMAGFASALKIVGTATTIGPHWLGVTWSLAIEEQFYLILPFLVRFLGRKSLMIVFVSVVVSAPFFRWILCEEAAKVLAIARSDSILIGGILALLVRTSWFLETCKKKYNSLLFFFILMLSGTLVVNFTQSKQGDIFNHLWLSIFFGLFILIPIVRHDSWLTQSLENSVLVWFGQRSYGVYLFHQPVSGVVHQFWHGGPPHFSNLIEMLPTVISLLITLLMTEISFRYYESYFMKIGHKIKYT